MRARAACGVATLAVGLALTACAGGPVRDDDDGVSGAASSTVEPSPAPSEAYTPPDRQWLPPEEEIDQLVVEAEAAFIAHWEVFDAASRTGFADAELLDALLASTAEDTLESVRLQVAAIGDTGRVVEGGSEVLGIEVIGLSSPQVPGPGIGIILDTCVRTQGVLREADGTAVRELSGDEPRYIRARVADYDGEWLVVSQLQQEEPCPGALLRGVPGD